MQVWITIWLKWWQGWEEVGWSADFRGGQNKLAQGKGSYTWMLLPQSWKVAGWMQEKVCVQPFCKPYYKTRVYAQRKDDWHRSERTQVASNPLVPFIPLFFVFHQGALAGLSTRWELFLDMHADAYQRRLLLTSLPTLFSWQEAVPPGRPKLPALFSPSYLSHSLFFPSTFWILRGHRSLKLAVRRGTQGDAKRGGCQNERSAGWGLRWEENRSIGARSILMHMIKVGQNHTYVCSYGVCMVWIVGFLRHMVAYGVYAVLVNSTHDAQISGCFVWWE